MVHFTATIILQGVNTGHETAYLGWRSRRSQFLKVWSTTYKVCKATRTLCYTKARHAITQHARDFFLLTFVYISLRFYRDKIMIFLQRATYTWTTRTFSFVTVLYWTAQCYSSYQWHMPAQSTAIQSITLKDIPITDSTYYALTLPYCLL